MFSTQKKDIIIRIILLVSLFALIGISITEHGIDSNGARSAPEQSVQPGRSSLRNDDTSFDIYNRPTTQMAGSRSILISDSSQKPSVHLGLPAHGPMSITSNADFATQDNWTGSGTKGNPYIFRNYSITTTGISGIEISNTDAYFTIQNVELTGAINTQVGIQLTNVTNGHLTNITTKNSYYGFWLDTSSNNTLNQNIANNNFQHGFIIVDSITNTLSNNTATSNSQYGFWLGVSLNNVLSNNTATNNTNGFYILISSNNTLSKNTASSNSDSGFSLAGSSNNVLTQNTVTNNSNGFSLKLSSNNNTISFNIAIDNRFYGIFIFDASSINNIVSGNKFIANNQGAIQAYDDGQFNNFSSNFWDDWTTPDTNLDGVVDEPYSIAGNANNQDAIPQAEIQLPPADSINPLVDLFLTFIVGISFGLLGAVMFFLVRMTVSKRKASNVNSDPEDNNRKQTPHQDVLQAVETLVQELDESEN